jgi:hypothetical protein
MCTGFTPPYHCGIVRRERERSLRMFRNDLLNCIIDDGLAEVRLVYTKPNQQAKREGALDAFERCRGRTDSQLLELLEESRHETMSARLSQADNYWYLRYFELQVAWVLNVLSAAMWARGEVPLIPPTSRALAKAADILGVVEI